MIKHDYSIGAILGIVAGVLLNYFIANNLMSMLVVTKVNVTLHQSPREYIITYLLALISALIASFILIFKIRKKNSINVSIINKEVKESKYSGKMQLNGRRRCRKSMHLSRILPSWILTSQL